MFNFKRSMRTETVRKMILATVAVASLGLGAVTASQPAMARSGHGGGFHGGGSHGRFFHNRGFRHHGFGFGGYYGYGYGGCYRRVFTPYGYRTVNVCY
jgi:hypothetical protein